MIGLAIKGPHTGMGVASKDGARAKDEEPATSASSVHGGLQGKHNNISMEPKWQCFAMKVRVTYRVAAGQARGFQPSGRCTVF